MSGSSVISGLGRSRLMSSPAAAPILISPRSPPRTSHSHQLHNAADNHVQLSSSLFSPSQQEKGNVAQGIETSSIQKSATHGTPTSFASYQEEAGASGSANLPNATVTLLKLELEQKRHELDSSRRTIARLQDDVARISQEQDTIRRTEAERRQRSHAQLAAELERERSQVGSLRDELEREAARCQEFQRAASDVETLRVENSRLSVRLKDAEATLSAKSAQLDATMNSKRQLENTLREFHQQDQSNVLSGKLLALEQIIASKDAELVSLQKALAAEGARLRAADDEAKTMWGLKAQLERDLGAAHIARGETEKQALKDKEQLQKTMELLHQAREERGQAEAAMSDREIAHSKELENLREDLRRRQQTINDLEYALLERESAVAAEKSQSTRFEQTIAYQNAEVESLAARLQTLQREVDRLEAKSGEDNVTTFDLRSQLANKKATIDALSRENQELSASSRALSDEVQDLRQKLSELQGVDDRNKVLSAIHERCEKDLERALATSFTLQEKVTTLEGELTRASRLQSALADMERTYQVCREEVEGLQNERRMADSREAILREELGELRARHRVTEAKLQAEEERRHDVERKVQLLESLSSSAYGMHGKYMALQQFIHTSTSDVAKAMELNSALLLEIRNLEEKCDAQDKTIHAMTEERRHMEIRAAEVDVLRRDASVALQRATQLEQLNESLQAKFHSVDAQFRRIKELEQLLVDATSRGSQFEEDLQRTAAFNKSLQQLLSERDKQLQALASQRDEDVREARAQAISANSAMASAEAVHEQQQTILKLTSALDQLRLDTRQSEMNLREELRLKDTLVEELKRELEMAKIPPPPPPKSQNSPQGQQVSFLKYECGRLSEELAAADRRFHEQEQRVEVLASQLSVAMRQLKELRGSQNKHVDPSPPVDEHVPPAHERKAVDDATDAEQSARRQRATRDDLNGRTRDPPARIASPGLDASSARRRQTALSVAQQQHVQRLRGGVSPPSVRSPLRRVHFETGASTTSMLNGTPVPPSVTKVLEMSSPTGQPSKSSGLLDNDTRQKIAELFRAAQVTADTPPASAKSARRPQQLGHADSPSPAAARVWSPTRPL